MPDANSIVLRGSDALTETEQLHVKQAIVDHLPEYAGEYQIERIRGNHSPSAKVFQLKAGENAFVVRILDKERYPAETLREILLVRNLSEKNVTPPIYHTNEATGIVIMKFINDEPIFHGSGEAIDAALKALAIKIRLLHSLPMQDKPAYLLPSNLQHERLGEIYRRAKVNETYQIFLQGAEYLKQLSIFILNTAFCHNNLHKHNVLYAGGETYIIDWETAGAGDPFLDLANFVALARFSNAQETAFLSFYLESEPSEIQSSRFMIMKQISQLRYALGLFTTVELDKLPLETLDLDTIPPAKDLKRKLSSEPDLSNFIYSIALLKEVFMTVSTPALIHAIRIASAEHLHLPESFLHFRLFAWTNPKSFERAHLAIISHLGTSAAASSPTPAPQPLSGGSEDAVTFKASIGDSPIALRVYRDGFPPDQLRFEAELYKHAHSLGVGPEVKFIDNERLCLATAFVEAARPGWQRILSNEQLTKLAQSIRKWHDTTYTFKPPAHKTLTGLPLHSLSSAVKIASDSRFSTLSDTISVYNRLLPLLKPEILSHNSLSRDNILFDGEQFQFIDWENATLNDRFYDPAFICCFFFLNPEQENILLTTYLGHKATRLEEQKFYLVKLLVLCHLALVTITKCHDIEFIAGLPGIPPDQRYFNYRGKARHMLNMQTDFGKYVIYQLLTNEIIFTLTTGKFLACERTLLKTREHKAPLSFDDLPLVAKCSIFSYHSRETLASTAEVSKEWARMSFSIADKALPTLSGLEAVKPGYQPKILAAVQTTFMPYKPRVEKIDAWLAPTVSASITPSTAGMSPWANTYKLIINDRPYVLRLVSIEPDSSCAKLEILIMSLFSAMKVAPKIHYASVNEGIIIIDFVDAIPDWHHDVTPPVLSRLGLLFNQMNELTVGTSKRAPFYPNKRLQQIYQTVYKLCREDRATDDRFTLFREALDELDRLRPLCEDLTEPTLCHHDFNVWNLLQHRDNHVFSAIDFEFSESGDRLFDIGSLVIFMRLDKKTEMSLLTSFFGRAPTEYENSKYYLFKQYAWLHYIVMGLGICKRFDFTVTAEEIAELPPFNEFSRTTALSAPIDPHTDIGHYKLAVMFIKQAKIEREADTYRESMRYLIPPSVTAASPA